MYTGVKSETLDFTKASAGMGGGAGFSNTPGVGAGNINFVTPITNNYRIFFAASARPPLGTSGPCFSLGFSVLGGGQFCVGFGDPTGINPPTPTRWHSFSKICELKNSAGVVHQDMAITGAVAGGYSYNTTVSGGAATGKMANLALGPGSDILGNHDATQYSVAKEIRCNGVGIQSYTGFGFRPNAMVFLSAGLDSGVTFGQGARMCLGHAIPGRQYCLSIASEWNAVPTQTTTYLSDNDAIRIVNGLGVAELVGRLVRTDPDGITIEWLVGTPGTSVFVCAFAPGTAAPLLLSIPFGVVPGPAEVIWDAFSGQGQSLILGCATGRNSPGIASDLNISVGTEMFNNSHWAHVLASRNGTIGSSSYWSYATNNWLTRWTNIATAAGLQNFYQRLNGVTAYGFKMRTNLSDGVPRLQHLMVFGSYVNNAELLIGF
jgi:hypothetical protein